MSEGDCESFNEFLRQNRLLWNEDVPNKLKCGKCKLILIDAHQISCGCSFCKICIDDMIETRTKTCPVHSEVCNRETLLESFPDSKISREIMKLALKCPEHQCGYEGELASMQEHLRLCGMKDVRCPFCRVGCNFDPITKDKMTDHLQSEGYHHNMILIDMIDNLKNEVNRLEENSRMKNETISSINTEIRWIKMEKQEMAAQINHLQIEFENKMINLKEQLSKECQDSIEKERRKTNDHVEKLRLHMTQKMSNLERLQNRPIDATLSWRVDKIAEKRQNGTNSNSEIFYPKTRPYKMQLWTWNYADKHQLYIRLMIHANDNDGDLEWPFQNNVSIEIANNLYPDASKTVTQYCNILQPNNNSYNYSEPFEFSFEELETAGLIQDDNFIIKCKVE